MFLRKKKFKKPLLEKSSDIYLIWKKAACFRLSELDAFRSIKRDYFLEFYKRNLLLNEGTDELFVK